MILDFECGDGESALFKICPTYYFCNECLKIVSCQCKINTQKGYLNLIDFLSLDLDFKKGKCTKFYREHI